MTAAVLDASAVIALLKGERGASRVAGIVANATVGVFHGAEIVSYFVHLGAPEDEVRTMLGALPYTVAAADEALGWHAGVVRAVTAEAGLSLGEWFCLALARQLDASAYTADRPWKKVAAAAGVKVVTIR